MAVELERVVLPEYADVKIEVSVSAACAAMVSAYWQHPLAQEDIARWLDTRPVGTPASRIVCLARRGFDVIYTSGAPATLAEWLNQGVPPILFVRTGDLQPH